MEDYQYVAHQMKEEIINDYLTKNPGVSRSEVLTKTVNGRVIVETIGDIFQKAARKERRTHPIGYRRLLEKLADGGDKRYADSIQSIKTCHHYADWLVDLTYVDFNEEQRRETNAFLDKRQDMLGRKSVEMLYVRKKFSDMMASKTKPQPSLIQTLSLEYLSTVMAQLKLQEALFNKEVELGGLFSVGVRGFISEHIDDFSMTSKKVLISIGKAIQYLKHENVDKVELPPKIDQNALKQKLDELGECLENRRRQFKMIKQLLNFLEQLVNNMSAVKLTPIQETPAEEKKTNAHRMVFSSREEAGRDRRR